MIRSLVLGTDTQIIQQPSVINGTSYYPVTVVVPHSALSNGLNRLLAACNPVLHLLFNLVVIPNVKHWNRRNLKIYTADLFCRLSASSTPNPRISHTGTSIVVPRQYSLYLSSRIKCQCGERTGGLFCEREC